MLRSKGHIRQILRREMLPRIHESSNVSAEYSLVESIALSLRIVV